MAQNSRRKGPTLRREPATDKTEIRGSLRDNLWRQLLKHTPGAAYITFGTLEDRDKAPHDQLDNFLYIPDKIL